MIFSIFGGRLGLWDLRDCRGGGGGGGGGGAVFGENYVLGF